MRCAMLAAVVAMLSGEAVSEVKVESDRFTGKTKIIASAFDPTREWLIALIADDKVRAMRLTTVNSTWKYLRCKQLVFLLDGRPYPIDAWHDGKVDRRSVQESFTMALTPEQVNDLAAAQMIEFKACNDERKFTDADLNAVRDFARAIAIQRGETSSPQQAKPTASVGNAVSPSLRNVESRYLFAAQDWARGQGCGSPVATMTGKGAGFELFTVTCATTDPVSLRCEYGVCRALQ